jgi:hypothetical protein
MLKSSFVFLRIVDSIGPGSFVPAFSEFLSTVSPHVTLFQAPGGVVAEASERSRDLPPKIANRLPHLGKLLMFPALRLALNQPDGFVRQSRTHSALTENNQVSLDSAAAHRFPHRGHLAAKLTHERSSPE